MNAPEGALGYRLMIPTSTPDDMLRMSPPLDATGSQGHYSLCPFQAPYDIRLMDGQIYRVVWTGASGEVIPPKTDGAIPGLHFFLTSSASSVRAEAESTASDSVSTPGTESVKTEGSRSVTQTEVDTQRDGTPVLDPKQTTEALTLDEKLHAALGEKPIELIMPRIELLLCAGQFQEAKLLAEQMLAVSPLDLNSLTAVEQLIVELKQLGKDGSSPPVISPVHATAARRTDGVAEPKARRAQFPPQGGASDRTQISKSRVEPFSNWPGDSARRRSDLNRSSSCS